MWKRFWWLYIMTSATLRSPSKGKGVFYLILLFFFLQHAIKRKPFKRKREKDKWQIKRESEGDFLGTLFFGDLRYKTQRMWTFFLFHPQLPTRRWAAAMAFVPKLLSICLGKNVVWFFWTRYAKSAAKMIMEAIVFNLSFFWDWIDHWSRSICASGTTQQSKVVWCGGGEGFFEHVTKRCIYIRLQFTLRKVGARYMTTLKCTWLTFGWREVVSCIALHGERRASEAWQLARNGKKS